MLTEPVEAASPDVRLVLIKSNVNPLSSKRNHVKLEVYILAQAVRAGGHARGIWICHVARGDVHGLGQRGGGDEGKRWLGLDTGAEVDESIEQLASEFDGEINAAKSSSQYNISHALP